jgi:hypothetical protein
VHAVRVRPGDVAELVVEGLDDVREPVQLRLSPEPPAARRDGLDLGVGVGWL